MADRRTLKLTRHNRARVKQCATCGCDFEKDPRNTWAYWERAKYCSASCSGKMQSVVAKKRRLPIAEDFSRWVSKTDGCWEWAGAIGADGYGRYSYEGRQYRAHRMAMELDGRPLKDGLFACHHCDNPRCVRPDHLFAGTNADNMKDMVLKGRHARQRGRDE